MNKTTLTLTCTLAAALAGSASADYIWNGSIDGDWTNAANWTGGVPVDVNGPDADLEIDNALHRIIFNASGAAAPVPTTNIPILGGNPFSNTESTPETDVLFGDLTFALGGFQGGVVGRDAWTVNVGDGNNGNGSASLTYTGNFASGINRDAKTPADIVWNVEADGTLNFTDSDATTIVAYGTDRDVQINIDGGTVNFNAALDLVRSSTSLGGSYFDLQSAGSSVTASFGVDFADLTAVNAATGTGLTFRSSTDLTLGSQDNQDGSFTVFVVPEPSSLALLGLGGLLIARRRRG